MSNLADSARAYNPIVTYAEQVIITQTVRERCSIVQALSQNVEERLDLQQRLQHSIVVIWQDSLYTCAMLEYIPSQPISNNHYVSSRSLDST